MFLNTWSEVFCGPCERARGVKRTAPSVHMAHAAATAAINLDLRVIKWREWLFYYRREGNASGRPYGRSGGASKSHLQGQLNQARRRGSHDLAEEGAVDIAIDCDGAEELGVIEGVEALGAEFQSALLPLEGAAEREIEVQRAGAVESAARRGSRRAERVGMEQLGIEIRHSVARIVVDAQRTGRVVGAIEAAIVDAVRETAFEGAIAIARDGDGKTGGGAGDAGDGPAAEGEPEVVGGHQAVADIPRGEGAAQTEVEGIDGIGEARRLIDRLAEGIREQQFEAAAGMAQAGLEGIVIRVADAGVVIVVGEVGAEPYPGAREHAAGGGGVLRILAEGAACGRAGRDRCGLAHRQTQRRVPGVGRVDNHQMMRLRAGIADAGDGVGAQLPLDGEEVVFVV